MKPLVFEHAIDVANKPAQVFAVVENFGLAPKWLDRCTGLDKAGKAPNAVGTKLRYTVKSGASKVKMDAIITEYQPNELFTLRCVSPSREVVLRLSLKGTRHGTRIVHTLETTPRSFLSKLLSPLAHGALRRRPRRTLRRLTALLESRDR